MKSSDLNYAHLQLGLTRRELQQRIEVGLLDLHIIKKQVDQNSRELKLSALAESWLQHKSLDQVDKFKVSE